MVDEFFHCYRPSEISQSKGMYSFLPRKPVLKRVFDIPDTNRNWKSRYFSIQGNDWMCHPNNQEYIPVDKTWGIMPPSSLNFVFYLSLLV